MQRWTLPATMKPEKQEVPTMFHRYKTPKYYLTLSADDLAMVKGILLWWRNKLIREGKPTEDVDELILKLMKRI